MGRLILFIVALSALWLLLSGYFDKPLLLGLGAASVLFTAWLTARARILDNEGFPIGMLFGGLIGYIFWLTREIGKSNIAVARQALAVEPKLSPRMIVVPNPPRSVMGKVIFANSITLTPGTVSIDMREDEILVHALAEEFADIPAMTDMGERVKKIEPKDTGGVHPSDGGAA